MKVRGVTQRDVLFLFMSMFIVVVAWISFNIYHRLVTSSITPEVQMQTTPIEPKFDTDMIQQLKTRQQVEPLYQLPKASPSATIEPEASIPANLDEITITPSPSIPERQGR
jgi:hypothetical protein